MSAMTNRENLAAAVAVSKYLGIDSKLAAKILTDTPGLPHRLQSLGVTSSVEWIDDSAASTPQSTLSALNSVGYKVDTLIVGGMNRNYDFAELAQKIAESNIRNIVLFPETGAMLRAAIEKTQPRAKQKFFETSDMNEAVGFARTNTAPGKACLLSSGAPSYNLYANFNERGDAFASAVREHTKTG